MRGLLKIKKKSSKRFSLKSVEATTKKHFAKTVLSLCSKTVLLRLLFLRGFNHFSLCFSTCFLIFKPLQKKLCPQSVLSLCSKTFLLRLLFLRGFNHFSLCFSTCFLIFKPLQKKLCPQSVLSLCSKTVLLRLLFLRGFNHFALCFSTRFLTFHLPDMLSRLNLAMCERRNIQVSSQVFLLRKLKLQQVLLDLQDDALQSQQEFLFQ